MTNVNEKKPKCIVYVRVSDPSQVDGTGLDEQEERCREYAEREGWEVDKVFREEGVSAKMWQRPEFMRSLDYLRDNSKKVQYFVIHKLDRISRNTEDQLPIMQALRQSGVELKSATEVIEETPAGRLMRNMLWAFGNFDNEVRAERCRAGSLRRFQEGYWVHTPPPGYRMVRNPVTKRSIPEMVEKQAKHIRKAFERRTEGWTYQEIAKEMNRNGYRTRGGKKIGDQNIEKILRSSFYMGLMHAFNIDVWGKHKPLVSKELWYKAQAVTKERGRGSETKQLVHPMFPLRGLISCSLCGKRLTASAPFGRHKHYAYYHHAKHKCEVARNVPKADMEKLFLEQLQQLRPQKERWELLKAVILEVWQERVEGHKQEQEGIQGRVSALLSEKKVLMEQHRQNPGMYTPEEFLEQKNELNNDIEEIRRERVDGEEDDRNFDAAIELAYSLLHSPAKAWDRLEIKPKQRFQRIVFPEGLVFDGKKFGTAEIALNLQLIHDVSLSRSNLVGPAGFEPSDPRLIRSVL